MHVDRENKSAKFWLDPNVALEANFGFKRSELRDIERVFQNHVERLREVWDEFCGDQNGAR